MNRAPVILPGVRWQRIIADGGARSVELDLADAAYWYEEQQKGLRRQFLGEALEVFFAIVETPPQRPLHVR